MSTRAFTLPRPQSQRKIRVPLDVTQSFYARLRDQAERSGNTIQEHLITASARLMDDWDQPPTSTHHEWTPQSLALALNETWSRFKQAHPEALLHSTNVFELFAALVKEAQQ